MLTVAMIPIWVATGWLDYCQYQYFCDSTFQCFYIQQRSFFPWSDY